MKQKIVFALLMGIITTGIVPFTLIEKYGSDQFDVQKVGVKTLKSVMAEKRPH